MAKHRQMPEDPEGQHCILTARAGKDGGRVQGVDLERQEDSKEEGRDG